MKKYLILSVIFVFLSISSYAYTNPYTCVSQGLFTSVFSGANLTSTIMASDFLLYNGTSCCSVAAPTGSSSGSGNCTADMSCDPVTYDSELQNSSIIRSHNTTWKVNNASNSDTLSGQLPSFYLDNTFNTTSEIQNAIDATFIDNLFVDDLTVDANTQLSDADILGLGYNHTSDIKIWVNANDDVGGNTTAEIFNVINNGSFQPLDSAYTPANFSINRLASGYWTQTNFSLIYASIGAYTITNLTADTSGWDKNEANDYTQLNFTNDYSGISYYKKANLTLDYPNLDTDSTDDLSLVTVVSLDLINATQSNISIISKLINVRQSILDNVSNHLLNKPHGNTTTEIRSQFTGGNNISIINGAISINLTCIDITGSADLCDGNDASSAGGGNTSEEIFNVVNNNSFQPLDSAYTNGNASNLISSYTNITYENNLSDYPKTGSNAEFGTLKLGDGIMIYENNGSSVHGDGAISIGEDADATGQYSIAIGLSSGASQTVSLGIGDSADATGYGGIALGYNSIAGTGNYPIAIGIEADSLSSSTISIGTYANTTNSEAIAIGANSDATSNYAISIGSNSKVSGTSAIAIGYKANATATNSVSIGYLTENNKASTILLGFNTTIDGSVTANEYCNATECHTISDFLIDTTGEDSGSGNCSVDLACELVAYDSELSSYQPIVSAWNIDNFTSAYASIGAYNINNLTVDYTTFEAYSKANLTLDYPNLDTDSTDDLSIGTVVNLGLQNATQVLTAINSFGFVTNTSVSITESQISNMQSYAVSTSLNNLSLTNILALGYANGTSINATIIQHNASIKSYADTKLPSSASGWINSSSQTITTLNVNLTSANNMSFKNGAYSAKISLNSSGWLCMGAC